MLRSLIIGLFILSLSRVFAQSEQLTGSVSSAIDRTPLPYSTVFIEGTTTGVYTDDDGKFELNYQPTLYPDTFNLVISFTGFMKKKILVIQGEPQASLNVVLQTHTLREAQVIGQVNSDSAAIQRNEMSMTKLEMKQLQFMPAIGGEVDLIKVIQLLPGVSGGVEGTIGFYVRGGNADQNLVLLDKAPVYEFGHLFGFYSVFNIDAVDDITMIKGGFPSEYGGRLSSILDIKMRSPADNKFHARGGIGLLSSRATLDFPIVKNKVFLSVSGRRTYIDNVVRLIDEEVPYYFYDLNAKMEARLGKNDRLFYTTYFGKDVLTEPTRVNDRSGGDFGFIKTNWINSLQHQKILNKTSTLNTWVYNSRFDYNVEGSFETNKLGVNSFIMDYGLRSEYKKYLNPRFSYKTGIEVIHHDFRPNVVNTAGEISDFIESGSVEALGFQEVAAFGNTEFDLLSSLLRVKPGLRVSGAFVGEKSYFALEPRLSMRYTLGLNNSIKASYSRMNQYIHRVSSAAVTLPTDMWYPVTNRVAPQSSDQIALGYEHFISKLKLRTTVEGYYKWMKNTIEYREGANLFLNSDFENELVQGDGNAYGMEFLVQRNSKKLSGWVAYTLSWSNRNFEELNGGETFFARYDRRHDISVTLNYPILKRLHLSCIWVYVTGSRFTPQTGNYPSLNASGGGAQIVPVFADRNSVQLSATHRLDLNLVLKSKPKPNRKWYGEVHMGVYNVYNRASPYAIQVTPSPDGLIYTQPGIFGFLPSVAYNFKFN